MGETQVSPGAGQALIRNLVRLVDFLPFSCAVEAVTMFASRRGQHLGDQPAGTAPLALRGAMPEMVAAHGPFAALERLTGEELGA